MHADPYVIDCDEDSFEDDELVAKLEAIRSDNTNYSECIIIIIAPHLPSKPWTLDPELHPQNTLSL